MDLRTAEGLRGSLKKREDLLKGEREAMFHLLQRHFEGVSWENFSKDLEEKDEAILLKDGEGDLRGFSTLRYYETLFRGEAVRVIFSGDTIVDPACWGSTQLPRTWIQAAVRFREEAPDRRLFWFLICSGYRTYHFLRLFFKRFHPCFQEPTPEEVRALQDQLALERYGPQYDPGSGVLRFKEGAQALRPGIGEVTAERMGNPHVAFFTRQNPGHERGDELVCLTEVKDDNVTAAWRRLLRETP